MNNTISFVVNAAINIPICAVSMVANSVILASLVNVLSSAHSSPLHVLLFGLAMSDLLVGLVVQPFFIFSRFARYSNDRDSFEILTDARSFAQNTLCGVSFLLVTCLSIERFLALHLHLRYKQIVTISRMIRVVVIIWATSGSASLLGIWKKGYFNYPAAPATLVCLVINAVLYYKIYCVVKRHRRQIDFQRQAQFCSPLNLVRLRSSFLNMFCVFVLFLMCYLPYLCIIGVIAGHGLYPDRNSLWLSYEVSWTFMYLNSAINPFLFAWRMKEIRSVFKRIISRILQKLSCQRDV